MRFLLALLLWLSCYTANAVTNIQAIQRLSTGTNNTPAALSVFTAGHRGPGTWTFSGGTNYPNHWKIGTNFPYRFPNVYGLNGTNYDLTSTKWLYYDPSAYDHPNDADYFTFTLPGGSTGNQSNLWMRFFLMLDHLKLPTSNLDLITMNGNFGGSTIVQLENGSPIKLKAHGQNGNPEQTNGWQIYLQTNVIYDITAVYDSLNKAFVVRAFDATNNFLQLTNVDGSYGSVAGINNPGFGPTNAYNAVIQANYLNLGEITGRIWMSPPVFGWSSNAAPPMPETNAIVSDRLVSWRPGYNVGARIAKPNRTLETNASFYGVSTTSLTNHTALNYGWSVAASNTVLLVDGADGDIMIDGLLSLMNRDGVTLRGTNNARIILNNDGRVSFGTTLLSASQAKQFAITNNTALKGATNLTLTTNYSALNAGVIAANQMYNVTQRDGSNPRQRFMSTVGYDYTTVQTVLIVATNGNSVTIWPPLLMDFTNAPMLVQRAARAPLASAIENITFTTTNETTHTWYTNNQIHILAANAFFDSWISSNYFLFGNNYLIDMYCAVNSDFNYNWLSGTAPNGDAGQGDGGGIQIVEGSPYIYNNVFDNNSRCFQFFGGINGAYIVGNYIKAITSQGGRAHSVANRNILWERNYFGQTNGLLSYAMTGDGYFGDNSGWVFYSNVVSFIDKRRFNWGHTIVGNKMDLLGDYGYPNLGNNDYIGDSIYSGDWAERTFVSGLEWNQPRSWFRGLQGSAPYVNRDYTNIVKIFTNVSLEITDGTNYLGVYSNWPFASVNYALIFSNNNTWIKLADYTNNPVAVSYLRAVEGPTESNMLVSGYVPVQNGWAMYCIGPDNFQQLQTIDEPTFQIDANVTNGVAVSEILTLPKNYPLWLGLEANPSWWSATNQWPFYNDAKTRYEQVNGSGVTNITGTASGKIGRLRVGR